MFHLARQRFFGHAPVLLFAAAAACSQSSGGSASQAGSTGSGGAGSVGASGPSSTGATTTSGSGDSTAATGSSTTGAGTGVGGGGGAGAGGSSFDAGSNPRDADTTDVPGTPPDSGPPPSGAMVVTNRYDNARSGANLNETVLTTSNVDMAHFGLLFSRAVDAQLYAEPLYLGGLTMSDGKKHNVVYVESAHNTAFAFDADDPAATAPLWKTSLGASGPVGGFGCQDMLGDVGVTATPVIDPAAGTIYIVSKGQEGGAWVQRLHAIDVTTGKERAGSPIEITASVNGTGAGSANGKVTFNPMTALNRPGLLLQGGSVYIAFGSHCDKGPYHGWILAYDAKTLQQTRAFNVTANGSEGAIWQSGVGLSADVDSIYFAVGNGSSNPTSNPPDISEGVGRLGMSDFALRDYWIANNYAALNGSDADMSTGAILFPYNLLLTGSKDGRLYVLDRTNLGKYQAGSDKIVQTLTTPGKAAGQRGHLHSGPIYYNVPGKGEFAYMWPEESDLVAYKLDATHKLVTPTSQSNIGKPGHPGGILTLSANGSTAGSAILWAAVPKQDAWHATVPGQLVAVDAADVGHVLWTSDQNAMRDAAGSFAKFNHPTVVNGHVYLATFSNQLCVYGLLK